jgi:hypothetical protein
MKELREQMKDLNKQMGDLHNSFGSLAEHLVAPSIIRRFNEMEGYYFESGNEGGNKMFNDDGTFAGQIDFRLDGPTHVMAVEIKSKVAKKDIADHLNRLEVLRRDMNKKDDHRKVQGAIAGAIFGKTQKEATIAAGLFVIEQTGDTMKINVPKDFKPLTL